MAFVSSFKKQNIFENQTLIFKAGSKRRPWRKTRTFDRLDALHRRMGAAVSVDLVKGITKFKTRIQPQKVYDAWLSGDYSRVMENIPWNDLKGDLGPALEKSAGVFGDAGKITIESLPAPMRPELRWDTKNPRVREWIASRTAENFTKLSQDSALNIQAAVRLSLNRALTPRQVAVEIRDSIGLLPRHAIAVRRYMANLAERGYPASNIQAYGSKYADRLLDYRATMIARTETRLATNSGQISVWRQAADQGLVDRQTTGKRWIVDGDPCPDCAAMDGVIVPIDAYFIMADGTTVDFPPLRVHPHCFCGMVIEYDLSPDDFDQSLPKE